MPDLTKTKLGWYCFKALPKKEHIAANFLNKVEGIDSFCPRIAYVKKTRRGKVRFIESLFPGYLFVRADLAISYRIIRSTQGIRDVVCFGERIPLLPDNYISDLKKRVGEQSTKELADPIIQTGQDVIVTEGPFKDIRAVVSGELDGHQRVAVLLNFLGRQLEISIPKSDVTPQERTPKTEVWDS